MKNAVYIAILALLSSIQSMAKADAGSLWNTANAFYQQKQYDSAAYYFEQIAAQKPQNANVYYNLGNTYYRLNNIPFAVLNYERALQVDPDHKDAKDNLAITQARISDHIPQVSDIFFISWWQGLTQPGKATSWAVAALTAFIIMMVLLWLRRFGGGRIPVQAPGIAGFVCMCLLVLAFASAKNSDKSIGAVVMEHDAPLMNNEQKGKPITMIPEGTTVKLLSEKGNWAEVVLPDGRTGWLLQDQVTKI